MQEIRQWRCHLLLLVGLSALAPCRAQPEFAGVLRSRGETYVALRSGPSAESAWYKVGESIGKLRIDSYDVARESVVLSDGASSTEIRLKGARVESAPTYAIMEQLARAGDPELQKLLPIASKLEERRAKAAADLAALESRAATDSSITSRIPELRRKLKIEEDNLAYWLQQVVKSARVLSP